MDIEVLKEIGMTESEAKVYIALLKLGSSSKGPIVQNSGVSSSKIYELLEKLIQKGLVSTIIKSGVTYFEAADPNRLKDYMNEKEEEMKKKKLLLEENLPFLKALRVTEGLGPETQVFKGMKGAKTSFGDILNELKSGDEYLVLGISKFTKHFEDFVINFHRRRAEKKIKCKIIVNELAKDIGKELKKINYSQVKYLQKELFTPFVFIIYKNKVLISLGLDEVFIQIKSRNLSEGLTNYFNYLWKISKS